MSTFFLKKEESQRKAFKRRGRNLRTQDENVISILRNVTMGPKIKTQEPLQHKKKKNDTNKASCLKTRLSVMSTLHDSNFMTERIVIFLCHPYLV